MADSRRELRWVLVGAAVAAVIGLSLTAYGVFSPSVLEHYADSPDSVGIAQWAARATWRDVPSWWAGTWIQQDSFYYRPLSSMLLWLEYRAFGWDFQGYVIVSWLVHGAICVCLYLLAMSVYPGARKRSLPTPTTPPGDILRRAAFAILSVLLFNLRLGPAGPTWAPQPVAYGVVAWWPAQTDQMSLVFSLFALLMFDGWLKGSRRNGLLLGSVLWVIALLFKEMALSLPLVAGCLILYRRGWASARVCSVEDAPEGPRRCLSPGLLWRIVVPGLLLGAGFLALRWALVPGGWGPGVKGPLYLARKALWFAAERPVALVGGRGAPLVIVSAFLACCIYVYARLPRRPSAVWLVLTMAIGAGALEQVLVGSFAMLTIPHELGALGTMTLLMLGVAVLVHARGGPAWPLLGAVAVVHLPILHVWGPHYLYWPAVFWGLFNASLMLYVWERNADGTLRWRRREPSATA